MGHSAKKYIEVQNTSASGIPPNTKIVIENDHLLYQEDDLMAVVVNSSVFDQATSW